jgi:hypothetical protein
MDFSVTSKAVVCWRKGACAATMETALEKAKAATTVWRITAAV